MNRKERRIYFRNMDKKMQKIAKDIIKYHNLYEGKDDEKLDRLVSDAISDLPFEDLMMLMVYLEDTIGDADS